MNQHLDAQATKHPEKIDFNIHGVVRIRLINPSPGDLRSACKLLGHPSRLPLTDPDITVRFVDDLYASGIRFLGNDKGFTDDGFFLLQRGTKQIAAQIPFDQIGGSCEIVCKSRLGSVPLLIPIVNLTALKRGHVPVHASAVLYNGVGILMAGCAHCGKTSALLGFASKGAEYVGEEWVLLSDDGQTMRGLVRPLELSRRHVASLPHLRSAVKLVDRCAFYGIGFLDVLQKIISREKTPSSLIFRGLRRFSAAVEDRLRPAVAPSAIFQDRVCSAGAQVDKILLFVSHDESRVEVEPITPFDMARRLAFLVEHELASLLRYYAAYRFAFPSHRNELVEYAVEESFGMLARALNGKENYIVRLPYPQVFPELYEAIRPLCQPKAAATAQPAHTLA